MKRDEWNKLYKKLQKGDKVVFYSVSRFGRNAEECWEYYEDLVDKGISFQRVMFWQLVQLPQNLELVLLQ